MGYKGGFDLEARDCTGRPLGHLSASLGIDANRPSLGALARVGGALVDGGDAAARRASRLGSTLSAVVRGSHRASAASAPGAGAGGSAAGALTERGRAANSIF